MRSIFLLATAFLLSSCDLNLKASLTDAPQEPIEYTETATYTSHGKEQSFAITLAIDEESMTVEKLLIEPLATDFSERSIQRVFAANIREEVLNNTIDDIKISEGPTNERGIREAFRKILKKVEAEL